MSWIGSLDSLGIPLTQNTYIGGTTILQFGLIAVECNTFVNILSYFTIGFCFVDFIAIGDAKRAFEALVHSTHLYGRRLVLEWAKKDDSLDELFEKNAKKLLLGNRKRKGPLSKKQLNESVEKAKLTGLQ